MSLLLEKSEMSDIGDQIEGIHRCRNCEDLKAKLEAEQTAASILASAWETRINELEIRLVARRDQANLLNELMDELWHERDVLRKELKSVEAARNLYQEQYHISIGKFAEVNLETHRKLAKSEADCEAWNANYHTSQKTVRELELRIVALISQRNCLQQHNISLEAEAVQQTNRLNERMAEIMRLKETIARNDVE